MRQKSRLTLLSDENRTLSQKVGLQGAGEAAMSEKLAEKSKEFDDLTARLESTQSSQGVMDHRIREELTNIQQETLSDTSKLNMPKLKSRG